MCLDLFFQLMVIEMLFKKKIQIFFEMNLFLKKLCNCAYY
jgi:hypothetical protein